MKLNEDTGVNLSPLGIMIYGDNNGLFELSENGNSLWMTSDERLDSVKIIRKDVKYSGSMSRCPVIGEGKDYDIAIFSTFFKEPTDIEAIAGVEIDGVFFSSDAQIYYKGA